MDILIIIVAVTVIAIISEFLYRLAGEDILKIFRWILYLFTTVIPLTLLMWIYESIKAKKWFDLTNHALFMVTANIIYFLIVLATKYIFIKSQNRKSIKTLNFGITYYDKSVEKSKKHVRGRILKLLTVNLIIVPALNI